MQTSYTQKQPNCWQGWSMRIRWRESRRRYAEKRKNTSRRLMVWIHVRIKYCVSNTASFRLLHRQILATRRQTDDSSKHATKQITFKVMSVTYYTKLWTSIEGVTAKSKTLLVSASSNQQIDAYAMTKKGRKYRTAHPKTNGTERTGSNKTLQSR